jgi:hypothetical protein
MSFAFNCPINSVSFGQVSVALLREALKRELDVVICPIGDKADLSTQKEDPDFLKWIDGSIKKFNSSFKREDPAFRLWHLNGSNSFISDNQALFTFYELDSPTSVEVNIAKNNRKIILSSTYAAEVFKSHDIDAHFVPLAFDKQNFKIIDKDYQTDGRIVFNLCGKFEFRKHHAKILNAWAKKYGDNPKYFLQCALFNPFLNAQNNNDLIARSLEHKKYFNMSFLPYMGTNAEYNDFLNSSDIVIGMSGGEGWGLPEFQSVAMGKHAVILNAHAYRDWATKENAVMIDPSKKMDVFDGLFFKKGTDYNQGQIFDWDEDDFINGCEEALKRVEANKVNEAGLKLQEDFTYEKTLDGILKVVEGS